VSGELEAGVGCDGHFGSVEDMIWDTKGQFVITVRTDQTYRLHLPWIQNEEAEAIWHEIGRPHVQASVPEIASVPVLSGLSNNPVYQVVKRQKETNLASGSDLYAETYYTPSHLDGIGFLKSHFY